MSKLTKKQIVKLISKKGRVEWFDEKKNKNINELKKFGFTNDEMVTMAACAVGDKILKFVKEHYSEFIQGGYKKADVITIASKSKLSGLKELLSTVNLSSNSASDEDESEETVDVDLLGLSTSKKESSRVDLESGLPEAPVPGAENLPDFLSQVDFSFLERGFADPSGTEGFSSADTLGLPASKKENSRINLEKNVSVGLEALVAKAENPIGDSFASVNFGVLAESADQFDLAALPIPPLDIQPDQLSTDSYLSHANLFLPNLSAASPVRDAATFSLAAPFLGAALGKDSESKGKRARLDDGLFTSLFF